jgi:hypothetical protein
MVTCTKQYSLRRFSANIQLLCFCRCDWCLQSVVALITTDVHNRDVVTTLLSSGVTCVSDFGWQMQLRFDYDTDTDSIMARQVNAR